MEEATFHAQSLQVSGGCPCLRGNILTNDVYLMRLRIVQNGRKFLHQLTLRLSIVIREM